MKILRRKKIEVDVNLTPLIDIVFLLLIFFMVSTTFTKETRLMLHLPEAEGEPSSEQKKSVEISISASSEYSINGKPLVNQDAQTLKSALAKVASSNSGIPVVITADANTPHQSVVRAMDVLSQIGVTNLQITTKKPAS